MSDAAPQMRERGLRNLDVENEQRDREREHAVAERLGPTGVPAVAHRGRVDAGFGHPAGASLGHRSRWVLLSSRLRAHGSPKRLRWPTRLWRAIVWAIAGSTARHPAQSHFDLLALTKLLTELTTLAAPVATVAIWLAEGLAGSALTVLWSPSTEDFTALVWLGKSLLAELTSDVASLWIFVTCDFRPLMSPLEAALVSPLTELSRSLRSEQ